MEDDSKEVNWAPRVRQTDIRRLYESEAQGRIDEELLEEVGISLYARCESWCLAFEARNGRVHCPRCNIIITHTGKPDDHHPCQHEETRHLRAGRDERRYRRGRALVHVRCPQMKRHYRDFESKADDDKQQPHAEQW